MGTPRSVVVGSARGDMAVIDLRQGGFWKGTGGGRGGSWKVKGGWGGRSWKVTGGSGGSWKGIMGIEGPRRSQNHRPQ